jgi:hypothetical protein
MAGWVVAGRKVSIQDVVEGNEVAELGVVGLLEAVDYFTWFNGEPSGVPAEGPVLVQEGLIDVLCEVAKVTLGEEQGAAVPDSLEKVQEVWEVGDGHRSLGAECPQLLGADLELDLGLSPGSVEPIEVLDVFLAAI